MTCNAYRGRTTSVAIVLAATGYLVMCGTTAEPAAGQGFSETANAGWSTQVWLGASPVDPAKEQPEGAATEKKSAANAAAPAAGENSSDVPKQSKSIEDAFRSDPQYEDEVQCRGAGRHLRREDRVCAAAPAA